MRIPVSIQRVIESFEKLPGIGPKSAQRLAFYLLHVPQEELEKFGESLNELKKKTRLCSNCHNIGEGEMCAICEDESRDKTQLCIVEQPLDLIALEKSGIYKGLYHVLHGAISPLNNIGPEQLFILDLKDRISSGKICEIILATNSTMEGEATAMYIRKMVSEMMTNNKKANGELQMANGIKITRIGLGLPVGADIEYADETTLSRALEGRGEY